MTSFQMLGLHDILLRAIEKQGFDTPTKIQAEAIPHLMDGKDLMGVAQTGGGKTAAFLLPVLHEMCETRPDTQAHKPQAIILAPTRELASQIGIALRELSYGSRLFHTVIFGGNPFRPQMAALERGVHILVATPGRLMDHMRRGTLQLDNVKTFILDEADRMLDMGFIDDVKSVAGQLPADHQTIMFSATMNAPIRKLADQLLDNPHTVEATVQNTVAPTIDHRLVTCHYSNKRALLRHLLESEEGQRTLVFTRTKAMADTLTDELQKTSFRVDSIHGDKPQFVRERVLKRFRKDNIQILIATDVAARGIDVPDISHVINYDMPLEGEAYVHRVGRTGRAGQKGTAYSICEQSEGDLLYMVERTIGMPVPIDEAHPFHADIDFRRSAKGAKGKKGKGKGRGKPFAKKAGFKDAAKKPFAKKSFGKKPFASKSAANDDHSDKYSDKRSSKRSDKRWADTGGNQRSEASRHETSAKRPTPVAGNRVTAGRVDFGDRPQQTAAPRPTGKKPHRKGASSAKPAHAKSTDRSFGGKSKTAGSTAPHAKKPHVKKSHGKKPHGNKPHGNKPQANKLGRKSNSHGGNAVLKRAKAS